jgi:hypothetical protein
MADIYANASSARGHSLNSTSTHLVKAEPFLATKLDYPSMLQSNHSTLANIIVCTAVTVRIETKKERATGKLLSPPKQREGVLRVTPKIHLASSAWPLLKTII